MWCWVSFQENPRVRQNISDVLKWRLSLQSGAQIRATSVAAQWPTFPAARFLLASAAINEELEGSGGPGVRAAAEQE